MTVLVQAARSIVLADGGWPRLCQPSTLRMVIWPEASSAQNSIAAVSAQGSTVCVLMLRLNSSCSRSTALVVRADFHWLESYLSYLIPGVGDPLLHVVNFALSLVIFTLLFAAMFKVLPDAEIAWRDVWVGAVATTLLFLIGKFAIGFYLGRSNPGAA